MCKYEVNLQLWAYTVCLYMYMHVCGKYNYVYMEKCYLISYFHCNLDLKDRMCHPKTYSNLTCLSCLCDPIELSIYLLNDLSLT